jgi:cytochrome c peroxidase
MHGLPENMTFRERLPLRIFLFLSFACFACKPALRDAQWQPRPTERMIAWFAAQKYEGFRGPTPYDLGYPSWYINREIPKVNLSVEAIELGRFLFYEKSLSSDSTVACATCHNQKFSFSDNKRFSVGVKGRTGHRNSMHLVNLVSDRRFFWDGRAASLEAQVLMPIEDANEMDLPLAELLSRLTKHPLYPKMFERAFGSSEITRERLADALAQFVKSIISYSTADDYLRGFEDGRITWAEVPATARNLFPLYKKSFNILNCGPCHAIALGAGQNTYDDIGLDADPKDLGYYDVTKNEMDKGKFKITVFRNLTVTGPYMHDGRFNTLKEVLEHYRSGMHRRPNISPLYLDRNQKIITESLTDEQIAVMIESMKLAQDEKVLTDPKYGDPF